MFSHRPSRAIPLASAIVISLGTIACEKKTPEPDTRPPTSSSIGESSPNGKQSSAPNIGKPLPSAQGGSGAVDEIPVEERKAIRATISFISERDGNREIYQIRLDDKGERRITHSPHADYNGPASPDGAGILAMQVEGEEGPQRLLLQPLDGSPARALSPNVGRVRFPSFSPDGRFVVYESDGGKENPAHFSDIYRVDRDGKNAKRLTNNPEGNFEPAISPSGDAIVFVSSRDRVAELYRMRPDGSEQARLTHTPRDEWGARFSPDGKLLAFVSDREGADRIWLMPLSGETEARRLTQMRPAPRIVEEKPTWSPTGKRIAYVLRGPDMPSRVMLVDMSDGSQTTIEPPDPAGKVNEPSFSPDGKYLAVTITIGGDQQIWLVRENGRGMCKLTSSPGGNWNPLWVPFASKGARN